MSDLRTFYVSIGNSDDKLSQADWANFARLVFNTVRSRARQIYGEWYSLPAAPFQNACIGFTARDEQVLQLQDELTVLRTTYAQESLAWAEVAGTVML